MKPDDLIKEAVIQDRSSLNEYESKQFLGLFGIPVIRESLVYDTESATVEAARIGFPVALKASGADLFHKTEKGGVVLNLRNDAEIREESRRLFGIPGCDALLVQEMATGHRELGCGLIRDSQFGPCVMFGLGGTLTELLSDVVFRIAPLTAHDAQEMIREIRCNQIVEPFRGESAVHTGAVADILISLGRIGVQHAEILEIDINPLKIRPDGSPVSIDALVTLNTQR